MCKLSGNNVFRVNIAEKSYKVYLKDVKFIRKLRKRRTPPVPAYDETISITLKIGCFLFLCYDKLKRKTNTLK